MTEPYQLMSAAWWRFSRYEIRDGLIRPAPGATLEQYDPWQDWEASRVHGVGRGFPPPYQSFVRLDRFVSLHGSRLLEVGEREVLQWCARYGLLGTLLQEPSYWLPAGRFTFPRNYMVDGKLRRLGPTMHSRYDWRNGQWVNEDMAYHGRLDPEWVSEVSYYFPDYGPLKRKYPEIPRPLSPDFWAAYGEPVDDFMWKVLMLSAALKGFLEMNSSMTYEVGPMELEPGHSLNLETDTINQLTGSVASVLWVDETGGSRSLKQKWVFRSLLACLAMMIQRDLISGGRVYLCANCHTPFVSSSPRALYCDPRCRNTAQKRHQRANQKSREAQGDSTV